MKQIADTASARFHVSPAFAFMEFGPPFYFAASLRSTDTERKAEARGNLRPVPAFVKIVRGFAAAITRKKVRTDLRGILERREGSKLAQVQLRDHTPTEDGGIS